MSVRHPNISAWQRHPREGCYTAEIGGIALTARWSRGAGEERGRFVWTAAAHGGEGARSAEGFEELESAMADAEEFARGQSPAPAGGEPG